MNTQQTRKLAENDTHDHRFARRSGWISGVILIIAGTLMLLQNMHITSYYLNNWWALFILIPAAGAFTKAWNAYRDAGRVNAQVRSSLIGGVILCLITAMFLFGLNWVIFGPALLMLVGVSLVVNGLMAE